MLQHLFENSTQQYTNTNTQIQIHKYKCTNTNATSKNKYKAIKNTVKQLGPKEEGGSFGQITQKQMQIAKEEEVYEQPMTKMLLRVALRVRPSVQ